MILALFFNFELALSEWIKRGQSIYEDNDSEKNAHRKVAISSDGQTIAYAVPYAEGHRGAVIIRKLDNDYFIQKGQTILGVKAGDHSGSAVAISASGDTVAIGSRYWDGSVHNVGHVRVFAYNGTHWNKFGDINVGEAFHDFASTSLDMSSDGLTVAIGAIGNDNGASSAGMVGVFAYNGTNWNQKGQSIYGEAAGDRSGHSVSIAGDTVAIGSDGSNIVRVYEYNDDNKIWTKQGHDIEGKEVSLSEDALTLAIGSPLDDTVGHNAGCVTMYESRQDRTWQQMGQPIYGLLAGDRLGDSISVSGDGLRVAMGSHLHKEGETDTGYLRIVRYDGEEWIPWGRTIYGAPNHGLGYSVSLSQRGDWVAVGASGIPQVWPGYARVYEYPIDAPSAAPTQLPSVQSASPSFAPSNPLTNPLTASRSRLLSSTSPTGSPSVSFPSLSPTFSPSLSSPSTAPTVLVVVPGAAVVPSVTPTSAIIDDLQEINEAAGLLHVVLLVTFILLMLLC